MVNGVPAFVAGLMTAGYLVIALFFARFWRDRRDRLFLYFSAAFLTLAVQRAVLVLVWQNADATLAMYLLRAFAFGLILKGIIDANRNRG